MSTSSIVTVFIFLTFFTVCNTDPLLGFTGCNATLQWEMSNSSYEQERTDFRIIDKTGDVIATKENNQCLSKNNLFMSCILSNKNDAFIIVLTLMNITTNHSGNYTVWVKEDLHIENLTTQVIVIDRPQIKEIKKPVLNQNFTVMCTISYTSDCITYYWKINGSDLQDTIHIHATMSTLTYTNVTMMDNFSKLTCQARLEKCSNNVCISSKDSNPYTVKLYYGPLYVNLSLNDSLVYLEENITFKVKCSASCYPPCTFRWESYYINVDNDELVIHNFNERLSGAYTCTAQNRETGVNAASLSLVLHHAKVTTMHMNIHIDDNGLYLLCAGLVIVAVCLIIVGALIYVAHRSKHDSTRLVNEPCAGLTNREITQDFLKFEKEDILFPIPAVPESSHRNPRRSWYTNRNRKSLSLHSFFNHDQALWSPIRQSLSLQSLIQLSHEIGRRANSADSLSKPKGRRFSKGISKTGIRPDELFSKVQINNKICYNEQNPNEISPNVTQIRPQSSAQGQEEMYSTISETSLSEYDYVRANDKVEYIQDNQRNTDAGKYEYDYAFLSPL